LSNLSEGEGVVNLYRIKYADLKVSHLIIFKNPQIIFAATRQNTNQRIRIFLINTYTNTIWMHSGNHFTQWRPISYEESYAILSNVTLSLAQKIPVYKVNDSVEELLERS